MNSSVAANPTPAVGRSQSTLTLSTRTVCDSSETNTLTDQPVSNETRDLFSSSSRPILNRAFTTDSTVSKPDTLSLEEIELMLRSRSGTFMSTTSSVSSVDTGNANSKITSSFKKLFIKPSKRNSDDPNSLTVIDDYEEPLSLSGVSTSYTVTGTPSLLNSPESSFRSSFNNSTALSAATSIDIADDPKGNNGSCFSIEKEEIEDLMSSTDSFDFFDDEQAYHNFMKKCSQKNNPDKKLKSKKSVFNFRRQQDTSDITSSSEDPLTQPETDVKGLRTIMNIKRQQLENHRLKKIRSVPVLRMPSYSSTFPGELKLPISPPAYQTSFKRGSASSSYMGSGSYMNSTPSRPPSSSLSSESSMLYHSAQQRASNASSQQSYMTSFSRDSVSSQMSQNSLMSQVSQYQTPSLAHKKY